MTMSSAYKSFSRGFKPQIPQLMQQSGKISDIPYEKYEHFVVAPARPIRTTVIRSAIAPPSRKPFYQPKPTLAPLDGSNSPVQQLQFEENTILNSQLLTFEHKLEKFLVEASETTVGEACEKLFTKFYKASDVIYWSDIQSLQILYSPTHFICAPYNSGILSSVLESHSITSISNPLSNEFYNSEVDSLWIASEGPLILFPLFDFRNRLCAIISILRSQSQPEFTPNDEAFMNYFQHKFQIFSRFTLNQQVEAPMILDILQLNKTDQMIPAITSRFENFYNCRRCEIWRYDKNQKKLIQFTSQGKNEIEQNCAGAIQEVLQKEISMNIQSVKANSFYNPEVDGPDDEAMIAIPVIEQSSRATIITVLRGPIERPIFPSDDEESLRKLAPFVALSIANADSFSSIQEEFDRSTIEREGLAALLEVAEILSGQLDTERLCEIIMEKGRYLTKADRCSLFLVSQSRDHLITSFHRGLQHCIDIPISKGIVGRTVTEAKPLNIADAYEDPTFDNTTDLNTGYRTKSILSVPIFNQRGEVMGVTEMINKQNGEPFTKWDTNLIQIFNVFCGISLENARLYKESLDMSSQLRSFFGISFSLSRTEDIRRAITDILRNMRRAVDARRASVFLVDEENNVLTSFIIDGGKMPPTIPLDQGIVGCCAQTKQGIIVNDAYNDSRFNPGVDAQTGFKTASLCATPIIANNGSVIGVVEMVNKAHGQFREKDLKLLQSLATFASISLENSRLKDLASLTNGEAELLKCMEKEERSLTTMPAKLAMTNDDEIFTLEYNVMKLDKPIDVLKMIFAIFYRFDIPQSFGLTNELLFRFVYDISKAYIETTPYHNWLHACDVLQFLAYELSVTGLDKKIPKLELLALLLSAICHDVRHDGLDNNFVTRTHTPFSILIHDESPQEVHHAAVTITNMTGFQAAILDKLSSSDETLFWSLLIDLIISTDQTKYCNLIDAKMDNIEDEIERHNLLKLLLNLANISNITRTFETAEKWTDLLCQEYFKQGDLEKSRGLEYSTPYADRNNPKAEEMEINFYKNIGLPLFQKGAKLLDELKEPLDAANTNFEAWKRKLC